MCVQTLYVYEWGRILSFLEYTEKLGNTDMITKLTFAFNDPAIVRMIRVPGHIINSWLQRAYLAASAGVPLNLTLK